MESLSCIQKLICRTLKAGEVPRHIGFIMDGNRRHAKKNKFSSTYDGHLQGVKSLKKCLLMCGELGIKEVSLFCFSIQNFNRSEQEVNGLMKLCVQTFHQMSSMSQILLRSKAKVNIIGRKQMLREDVRQALQSIQDKTKQFGDIIVNLCFAYDSIHEIQTSILGMQSKSYGEFINGLAIPHHLDILVRTASEYRLSNFMLPQAAYAYICILKENWPQINLFSFCKILLGYNYYHKELTKSKSLICSKMGNQGEQQATQLLGKYKNKNQ